MFRIRVRTATMLSSPIHVVICGRQGIDYGEDEASGELKSLGYRMRAEGETAYEPDLLLRLEAHRPAKNKPTIPVAHVEKDRTGVLSGQTIAWPTFDNVAKPLIGLLGTTQASAPTEDEVGHQDAEALARQETERAGRSAELAAQFTACFGLADGVAELAGFVAEGDAAVEVEDGDVADFAGGDGHGNQVLGVRSWMLGLGGNGREVRGVSQLRLTTKGRKSKSFTTEATEDHGLPCAPLCPVVKNLILVSATKA